MNSNVKRHYIVFILHLAINLPCHCASSLIQARCLIIIKTPLVCTIELREVKKIKKTSIQPVIIEGEKSDLGLK